MIEKEIAKQRYIDLLKSTGESKIDELVIMLDRVHFFEKPATTNGHDSIDGGMCIFSLKLQEIFNDMAIQYALNITPSDIIWACLLHGIGKATKYALKESKPISEKQIKFATDLCKQYNQPVGNLLQLNEAEASLLITWLKDGAKGERPIGGARIWEINETRDTIDDANDGILLYNRYTDKYKRSVAHLIEYQDGAYTAGVCSEYLPRIKFNNARSSYPEIDYFATAKQNASLAKVYKRLNGADSDLY